jgi:hypothetical protein
VTQEALFLLVFLLFLKDMAAAVGWGGFSTSVCFYSEFGLIVGFVIIYTN